MGEGLLQDSVTGAIAILVNSHVSARSHDVNIRPRVRVVGARLVKSCGAHGDAIVVIGRRIAGSIPSLVLIARGANNSHPFAVGVGDRIFEGRRGVGASEAHVDDMGAVISGIVDAVGNTAVHAVAGMV